MLQEHVKIWVALGVISDFKERHEQVVQQLLEAHYETVRLVYVTETYSGRLGSATVDGPTRQEITWLDMIT